MQRQLTTTMSQLNRTTSATEALKNAEALFESKNIGEIREVLTCHTHVQEALRC
jgi:hypothetical protein